MILVVLDMQYRHAMHSAQCTKYTDAGAYLKLLKNSDLRFSASCFRCATISSAVGPRCFLGVLTPPTSTLKGASSEGPREMVEVSDGARVVSLAAEFACALRALKQRGDSGAQKAGCVQLGVLLLLPATTW